MQLAETNKKMRKELELLTRDTFVLSAICRELQDFVSEDSIKQAKSQVKEAVRSRFSEEEVNSYSKRSSDRLVRTTLEFEITDMFKRLEAE